MSWFNTLTERQIAKARAEGKLDHLQGEGQPLPERPGDAYISPGDAMGFRIMADAGVLPQEITLKKQAAAQRARLATLTDPAQTDPAQTDPAQTDPTDRKAAMAELARLEMLQAIAEESRRKFLT